MLCFSLSLFLRAMSYCGLSLVAWTLLHTPRRIETRHRLAASRIPRKERSLSLSNPSKGETRIAGRSLADGSPSGERVDVPNGTRPRQRQTRAAPFRRAAQPATLTHGRNGGLTEKAKLGAVGL